MLQYCKEVGLQNFFKSNVNQIVLLFFTREYLKFKN